MDYPGAEPDIRGEIINLSYGGPMWAIHRLNETLLSVLLVFFLVVNNIFCPLKTHIASRMYCPIILSPVV
jgi:hypothetical protein